MPPAKLPAECASKKLLPLHIVCNTNSMRNSILSFLFLSYEPRGPPNYYSSLSHGHCPDIPSALRRTITVLYYDFGLAQTKWTYIFWPRSSVVPSRTPGCVSPLLLWSLVPLGSHGLLPHRRPAMSCTRNVDLYHLDGVTPASWRAMLSFPCASGTCSDLPR